MPESFSDFPQSDRYTATSLLGVGASSRVYTVVDHGAADRIVALKLFDRRGNDDTFFNEFRILQHLSHPMLATVFDVGMLDGRPFFSQKWVGGPGPVEYCKGQIERVAQVGSQLGWVLAFVHRHGIVHLDVKPDNLRMDGQSGRLTLLDFGLAVEEVAEITRSGTPAFVAPEILSADAPDHRADLYSLGATLYYLICGRPPFVARSLADHMRQLFTTSPLPVRDVRPDCPVEVAEVIDALLSRDPARRPDSGAIVTTALTRFAGADLPEFPPGLPGRIGRNDVFESLGKPGQHRLVGPPDIGKSFLMNERLRLARRAGKRVGIGRGLGLDSLESAIRDAGGEPGPVTEAADVPLADRMAARLEGLLSAITADMVLGLPLAGELADFTTPGTVIVTEVGSVSDDLPPFTRNEVARFLEAARPGRPPAQMDIDHALKVTGGFPGRLARLIRDPDSDPQSATDFADLAPLQRRVLFGLALLSEPIRLDSLSAIVESENIGGALLDLMSRGLASRRPDGTFEPSPTSWRGRVGAIAPLVERPERMATTALNHSESLGARRIAGDRQALITHLRAAGRRSIELRTRRSLFAELFELTGLLDDGLSLEKTLDEMGLLPERGELLARLGDQPAVRVRRAFFAIASGQFDGPGGAIEQAAAGQVDMTLEPHTRGQFWRVAGLAQQALGRYDTAREAFATAGALLEGDPASVAHCVHDHGVCALYLGRYAEALPHFSRALGLKIDVGDRSGARITRQNIGICHEALGQPRLASGSYSLALTEAQRTGSLKGQLWNHMALGGLLRRMGRDSEAAQHLDRAEALADQVQSVRLSQGVEAERALLANDPTFLKETAARLRAHGNHYDADRLMFAALVPDVIRGEPVDEVPGETTFAERHAAFGILAGQPGPVPEGSQDALVEIARAHRLKDVGKHDEAEAVLLDALEQAWARDDRAWLLLALGRSESEAAIQRLDVWLGLLARLKASRTRQSVADSLKVAAADAMDATARLIDGNVSDTDDIARTVAATGEMVLAHPTDDSGAKLCLPMPGGAVLFQRSERFGAADVNAASAIADATALALEAIHLRETVTGQAEEIVRLGNVLSESTAAAQAELRSTRLLLMATRTELVTRFEYAGVIGRSRTLQTLLNTLDKVVPTTLSLLLEGESGTGKELLAQAVHVNGPKSAGTLVAVDCGAIVATLFESAFFGHRKGSFTGALADRAGYLSLADGGTLFLDEVGELPLEGQAKLLRALETGRFWPVGATKERASSFRVVAATHRNLEDMVEAGTFRRDLFYRLAQVRVSVPPLRDRPEDIPIIAEHFQEVGGHHQTVSPEAMRALVAYDWPGNIRELKNEIERAGALSGGDQITVESLSDALRSGRRTTKAGRFPRFTGDLKSYVDGIERRVVAEVMERENQNLSRSADVLGLSRHGLRKKLRRLGLRDD